MKKRIITMVVAVFMVFGASVGASAAETNAVIAYTDTTPVTLNGTLLDASAYTYDGGLYLPLREMCENLGYTVAWSGTDGSITVSDEDNTIVFDLANWKINDNGHEFYMTTSDFASGYVNREGHVYLYSGMASNLFSLSVSKDEQEGKVIVTSVSENPIVIKAIKISSKNDQLIMNLEIPQVYGLADTDVQESINSVFRNAALDAQKEIMQDTYEYQNLIENGYDGNITPCELYYNYSVKYNRNQMVSLVVSDYRYIGGAHGMTVQSSYTFNLTTGKMYTLSDLMKEGSGYVSLIDDAIRTMIDQKVTAGLLYEFDSSPFETVGDNPAYYLSNEGVVFYFQQYEYFPYAAGIQEFTIPFSSIKEMLKSDFSFLAEQ